MYTVNQISKQFDISRSALIYYEKIGLLKASSRTKSNYRLYSEADVERLNIIIRHREAGISLDDIQKVLDFKKTDVSEILIARLGAIELEIETLKRQEDMILSILKKAVCTGESVTFNRESWSDLLKTIGYSEGEMMVWHKRFERDDPKGHAAFLSALGISKANIKSFIEDLIKDES